MDTEIMVESLPLIGLCNLCLKEGAVKSMLISQYYNGVHEIYTEMLIKCYSIDIVSLELGDAKRLICDDCVERLREAVKFKDQVERSLHVLKENYWKKQSIKPTEAVVKTENNDDAIDHDYDDFFDDDDDLALNEFKIKTEPIRKQEPRKPRSKLPRTTTKSKYITVNKANLTEVETMLQAGLFPFKMRKNHMFSCSLCPEKSPSLDDIKSHVKDHTRANILMAFKKMMFSKSNRFFKWSSKLRCKICTTDVSNYDELKDHVVNCSQLKYRQWNNLPFKLEKDQLDCPVCNKRFLNYVSLNTHMNVHYPNYICENCGKAFASKARLRGHMRTHEVGHFPCRHCDAVFDRVTKRENHVSKEHKSGVRYACKRCNISLTSFYARQKHLAEVHNEELKRYKCKVCPQSYITPGHLSSHVRRDHLNERNHKCDKCELAFYTKNALKMHMIKHDGERIHSCHICQKSYQRKKTLREHMRIHDNDKRFVCPVCGRAFTQKCTLKGHLKVHERKVDLDDRIVQPLHSPEGLAVKRLPFSLP